MISKVFKDHIANALTIFLFVFGLQNPALSKIIDVKQLGGGDYTTISQAIFFAEPNDEIVVYPGRYEEAVVIDRDLTLTGKGPQLTTIYSPEHGVEIETNCSASIKGFTITASICGIYLNQYANLVIRNNCIVSNGDDGIYVNCDTNSTIINNTISSNSGCGINLKYSQGHRTTSNMHNNIVHSNGEYGISWSGYTFSDYYLTVSYNNVFGNSSGDYYKINQGTGNISLNPEFIDYSTGNFVLQVSSPSINLGRPGSADIDPDGTRNDMGAYGGPDSAAFWPYPLGAPVITEINATPTSVIRGETIVIEAVGEILE